MSTPGNLVWGSMPKSKAVKWIARKVESPAKGDRSSRLVRFWPRKLSGQLEGSFLPVASMSFEALECPHRSYLTSSRVWVDDGP